MLFSNHSFHASDGLQIQTYRAMASTPKVNLLIVHGMAEHGRRYERFAEKANAAGINVFTLDLRGHGETSKLNGARGSFGEGGWKRVTLDLKEYAEDIQSHSSLPFFLFGHSMGSMLSLAAVEQKRVAPDGLILSAFPPHPGMLTALGKGLARILGKGRKPNKFMNKLTFGKFNQGISDAKTEFDWLSRDENEVKKYIEDPDCGEVFSTGFFYELADLTDFVHHNSQKLKVSLPVLYIAGGNDPVVEKEKGAEKVVDLFQKQSSAFTAQIFQDARHELLNETNREQVSNFVLDWIVSTTA